MALQFLLKITLIASLLTFGSVFSAQDASRGSKVDPVRQQAKSKQVKARAGQKIAVKSKAKSKFKSKSKPNIVAARKRPSFGDIAGLQSAPDALALKSSVAFVIDQDTKEVLLHKNELAVLPIASITKLMTGVLISEARLPMDDLITISQDDVDMEKGSRSRLIVGTTLSRAELLHLALMVVD